MAEKKKRIRLDYLDIAKCLTILLVIIGHTTEDNSAFYRIVLYSFHMPLFFIVSGMVIRKHRHVYDTNHWRQFLLKNATALVIPYLVWGLIFSPFSFASVPKLLYGSWYALKDIQALTSLWYIPCLFCARVMMEFVLMTAGKIKMNRHLFGGIVSVCAFAIGLLLPKIEGGYFWCIDIAFVALGFMLMGYAFKDLCSQWVEKNAVCHAAAFVLSAAIFVAGIAIQNDSIEAVMMCKGLYANVFWFFVQALSGSAAILSLSILLSKLFSHTPESRIRKGILWVGQNTFGIYLLHKPFVAEVVVPFIERIGISMPTIGGAVLAAVIGFVYSCILTTVIKRYIPQLLGVMTPQNRVADRSGKS